MEIHGYEYRENDPIGTECCAWNESANMNLVFIPMLRRVIVETFHQ